MSAPLLADRINPEVFDQWHSVFLENYKSGRYYLPLPLVLYNLIKSRYGEDRVDVSTRSDLTTEHNTEAFQNYKFFFDDYSKYEVFNEFVNCWEIIQDLEFNPVTLDDPLFLIHVLNVIQKSDAVFLMLVKFPEINITNGRQVHLIRDLYVSHTVLFNGTINNPHPFTIIRSTYEEQELLCGYRHSHAPKMSMPTERNIEHTSSFVESICSFTNVCVGKGALGQIPSIYNIAAEEYRDLLLDRKLSEPIFEKAIDDIEVERAIETVELHFLDYLLLTEEFLAWESLDGVPYMRIANLPISVYEPLVKVFMSYDFSVENHWSKCAQTVMVSKLRTSLAQIGPRFFIDAFEDIVNKFVKIVPSYDVVSGTPKYKLLYDEYEVLKYASNNPAFLAICEHIAFGGDCYICKDDLGKVKYYNNEAEIDRDRMYDFQDYSMFVFKDEAVKLKILPNEHIRTQDEGYIEVKSPFLVLFVLALLERNINLQNTFYEYDSNKP